MGGPMFWETKKNLFLFSTACSWEILCEKNLSSVTYFSRGFVSSSTFRSYIQVVHRKRHLWTLLSIKWSQHGSKQWGLIRGDNRVYEGVWQVRNDHVITTSLFVCPTTGRSSSFDLAVFRRGSSPPPPSSKEIWTEFIFLFWYKNAFCEIFVTGQCWCLSSDFIHCGLIWTFKSVLRSWQT